MPRRRLIVGFTLFLSTALSVQVAPGKEGPGVPPSFTTEQAASGKLVYDKVCGACHGVNLNDGEFAPPLKGQGFMRRWGGKSADTLFMVLNTMPLTAPRSLGSKTYANLLAYLLQSNGVHPADAQQVLPEDPERLQAMLLPFVSGPGNELSTGVELPPPPDRRRNPLEQITPVTEEMLAAIAQADWLTWRGGNAALGYSELAQINRDNVARLQLAWSWSLPEGPSQVTPLVHDGVIFAHGWGDVVQALDATTGELLWEYRRWLPESVATNTRLLLKRSMALYGDNLYVGTSDAHLIALEMKTGRLVWDAPVGDVKTGYSVTGGPLIAKGKVILGTTGSAPGGNYIVGLDARTGAQMWRLNTIAQPGSPNGQTWNGAPLEKRTGASVWTVGSYDAASDLVFFGTSEAEDTKILRHTSGKAGVSNAAFYTDSTLAIDPDTGELKWYYQHLPNDQWDLDWGFEQHLVSLPVKGAERTEVVAGGKAAIYDILEARSGRYVSSIDLGLQDFITAIDPRSGAKRIDSRKTPGKESAIRVCPHADGAKSWLPSAYNPRSSLLFVPLMEICMELVPVAAGEEGVASTGMRWTSRPRPNSDGRYGRLEAVNLQTHRIAWIERQRAPRTSGLLATAGGLVFSADLDRYFSAYDQDTGRQLWRRRLNDVSNAAPITFSVNGTQYLAITVGHGPVSLARHTLVPEIHLPSAPAPTLWVFKVL